MKKWVWIALALVLAFTGTVIAFASQENEMETGCEHDYQIVSLEPNGSIILMCENCSDRITTTFAEHLNTYYAPLDVVADGIVNAKDYAYILKHYKSDDWGGESVPPIF